MLSYSSMVSLAFTAVLLVVSLLFTALCVYERKLSTADKLVVLWLIWDGLIHMTLVCAVQTLVINF